MLRKVNKTTKNSTFQLLLDTLGQFGILNRCSVNKTDFTIVLPNGSIFLCSGLDDPEKIKSITDITDIWCEEATELAEDEYTQLDLRLRALAGDLQLIVSFNPISKVNWVYKKWFAESARINADTMILKTTYKDNRFLPDAYIAALEDKIHSNYNYYRIYALGEFITLDKLVFNNWKIEEFNHAEINGQLLVGLDFGFVNDISAIVASLLDEDNKRIYIFKNNIIIIISNNNLNSTN